MPFGNGTGPQGAGPMTGRGAGYCAGYSVPGYINPIPGGGRMGLSRGRGRGWRNQYYATGMPGWARGARGLPAYGGWVPPAPAYVPAPDPQDEAEMLKNQADLLKRQLDDIQNRISTLEQAQKEE